MDGTILIAFILGFPANEIVVPVMLMAYLSQGTLVDAGNLKMLGNVLYDNGWTWVTAVCVLLFSLMHWPVRLHAFPLKKKRGVEMDGTFCIAAYGGRNDLCFCFPMCRNISRAQGCLLIRIYKVS